MMKRFWLICALLAGVLVSVLLEVMVVSTGAVAAQPSRVDRPVIRGENADLIHEVLRIGNGTVRQVVFAPDGDGVGVATDLGAWVINVATGGSKLLEGQGGAHSVAFSPLGTKLVAAGGEDNSVMVWDAENGHVVARLENHIYPIGAVAWSDNGHLLASGDQSGVIRTWDTSTWQENQVYSIKDSGAVLALDFDFGAQVLFVETTDAPARVTLDGGDVQMLGGVQSAYTPPPIATLGARQAWIDGETLRVTERGREIFALSGFYDPFDPVYFLPEGWVGGRTAGSTWYWLGTTGFALADHAKIATSPDGSRTATFGNDGVIRLTDTASGDEIAALHGHIRAVTSVAFSPDGSLLASSSDDGTIQLWDATVTEDSGALAVLRGHNGGVRDVAFSADGTLIASAGYDGTVRLWAVDG